jgi:hypothetical protein
MSTPAEAIPTQPSHWCYPTAEAKPSADYRDFLQSVPTSTVKASEYFRSLAKEWNRETGHLSLISQRVTHPAYRRIIRMGGTAVPLILEEMRRSPTSHWFHALVILADENPIPQNFNGTVAEAVALWVAWGRQHKLIDA